MIINYCKCGNIDNKNMEKSADCTKKCRGFRHTFSKNLAEIPAFTVIPPDSGRVFRDKMRQNSAG
jgi:hypothetical protein